jgi:signal transduction histidine kinase
MIKVLDKSVSDKIAAGEVVDRPLSIVKELVENSIDSGATSIICEIKNGGKTYIRVTDNGCGIPADIQAKIFQPNFTTKSNGNGLGLAISKHIVEGTGGRIDFESSPKGTTFYIYFRKK